MSKLQRFGVRTLWLGWVTLIGAIAVLLGPVLHLPSLGLYPVPVLANAVSASPVRATLSAQAPTIPATVRDNAVYGSGLRRTLHLLASSTPTQHNTVRILFYGQSLTKQDWWLEVVNALRQQFPNAHLIVENRAIGGFASPLLVRAAEHDLYSFYPDLMIFHNYGDEKNYEAIIANTKRRTTAEIALMSDHVAWLPGEPTDNPTDALKTYRWHNQHVQWLGAIAQKYGCELIDIRTPWETYLKNNHLSTQALLIENDGHLNRQGNRLMAQLVTDHLLHSPVPTADQVPSTVVDYAAAKLPWQNGKLRLEFQGNRIDLVTRSTTPSAIAAATVLIDGKRPSQWPTLYQLTRPSDAFHVDVPGILRVQTKAPLQLEDWSLFITEVNSAMTQFKFQVYGSKTGFDGEGSSTQRFVSRSGRVVIDPDDWWLDDAAQFTQRPFAPGFQIRWRVDPLFTDVYVPPPVTDPAIAVTTTLAQNLSNSRHMLELLTNTGQPLPLDAIRVYRPAGK